jgi:transcription antitermination factor NusG
MEVKKVQPAVKQWHVIYTKSKWEKKVDELLMQKGFESWCPVEKKERYWTDRKKIIEVPLFRSYVFVKISKEEYTEVLSTIGVVNFLYFEKKPAIIRDIEVEEIRKYLGLATPSTNIEIIDLTNLPPQTKVAINQGLFMKRRGEVIKASKHNVFVRLESINLVMIVEFKPHEVSPI